MELARKAEALRDVREPELRSLEHRRGELDAQRLRALDRSQAERVLEEAAPMLRRHVNEAPGLGQSKRRIGVLGRVARDEWDGTLDRLRQARRRRLGRRRDARQEEPQEELGHRDDDGKRRGIVEIETQERSEQLEERILVRELA